MNEDDKIQSAISRGKRAELLLQDDLLAESLQKLEDSYIAGWRATLSRDTDARERLWQAVQVVGKVKDHLRTVVNNGKVAKSDVDDLARPQKRFGIV